MTSYDTLKFQKNILPNLTALELIRQCGFSFKSLDISLSTFGAFLLHAQRERVDFLKILRKFFSTVESVTLGDRQDKMPHGVNLQKRIKDSSQELLQQGMETFATTTLESISIVADYPQPVIDCITPSLTLLPSCLQTFKYVSELQLPNRCFRQLQSILLNHMSSLRTISIKQVKYKTDPIPWNDLFSWLQASLASQCLQLLKVNLHSVYLKDFLNMLGLFLSASFSQKQILSLNLFIKSNKKEISSSEMPSVDFLKKQLEKVDDRVLQNKSIEFVAKGYSFFLSKLNPIRLGGLIATEVHPLECAALLKQFETNEAQLKSVDLGSSTYNDYKNLFNRRLLKSIIFSECENIVVPLLERAATLHGFTFEEIKEPNLAKSTYIATKVPLYEAIK